MKNILIQQLLKMCANNDFLTTEAESIIKQINLNEPVVYKHGELTTFLGEAIKKENIKMIELLLKNGADPNLIYDNENVFWDLQYSAYPEEQYEVSDIADKSDELRLKIAQLLLDYGANPNIIIDSETLFSYVYFKVFEDSFDRNLKYLIRYFILLVAYGGETDYCKPKLKNEFDKRKIHSYHLNGSKILDKNNEVVAEL